MRASTLTTLALCGLALTPLPPLAPDARARPIPQPAQLGMVQDRAQPADRNAALDYWRLITQLQPKEDLAESVKAVLDRMQPPESDQARPEAEPAELMPGGALAIELADLSGFFDDARRASLEPRCDFQVRYEDGYAALLPHLAPMRSIARLLVADARRLALADDPAAAAERLGSALRLAHHVAGDRTLISSLVSAAIADLAGREAHWLLDRTGDDASVSRPIAAALPRLLSHDPYQIEAALRTERDLVASLPRQFNGPFAGRDFAVAFGLAGTAERDASDRVVHSLNAALFKTEVERALDAFDLILEAWRAPDPQAALELLSRQARDNHFGVVARMTLPDLRNANARAIEASTKLETLRQRVGGRG